MTLKAGTYSRKYQSMTNMCWVFGGLPGNLHGHFNFLCICLTTPLPSMARLNTFKAISLNDSRRARFVPCESLERATSLCAEKGHRCKTKAIKHEQRGKDEMKDPSLLLRAGARCFTGLNPPFFKQ